MALARGVSVGTVVRVANGYEPRRPAIREALGLPPLLHLSPGAGVQIAEGSIVLRDSRICACGCQKSFVPNSWNHRFLPGHRRRSP